MLLWRWTPRQGSANEGPSSCQKVHWTLMGGYQDGSIFTHFNAQISNHPWLAPALHLASGLRQICREFLWTPLLLFLIVLDDTLLIFSPLLFSQERDCSVVVYRKREDSWWGRCLGNCMNQSWPYLISGYRSGGQVCFLTVFFSFVPLFLCSCYLKVS